MKKHEQVISVFIALHAAVIFDSAPLPCTSPTVWDPEAECAARLSVRDPTVLCTASFPRHRPSARSPHRRRPATVLGQAADNPADLGWIENDSDHFHSTAEHGRTNGQALNVASVSFWRIGQGPLELWTRTGTFE